MSYFIANTIKIDLKKNKFTVKGGDNNVIPRCNHWLEPIDLRELYYCIISGNMDLRIKTELACLIKMVVGRNEFNSGIKGVCYFDLKSLKLPKSENDSKEYLRYCKKYKENYKDYKMILENQYFYSEMIKIFEDNFLEDLKSEILNLKKSKKQKFYLKFFDDYVSKIKMGAFWHHPDKERAMIFGKYRAMEELKNFRGRKLKMEPVLI
jgi:hypothetical protein